MTVRIRVKHTCANRSDGYPFSKFRGHDVAHTGTGVITCVFSDGHPLFDSDTDGSDNMEEDRGDDGDSDKETKLREDDE